LSTQSIFSQRIGPSSHKSPQLYKAQYFFRFKLVVAKEKETPEQARQLIVQARSQYPEALTQRGVLELIEMVMVYKFSKLSRQEIEAMLKLDGLKETKVYQEALEEGKLEGKLEAIPALVARGFSVEEIAEILRLTVEEVRSATPQP
jgi:predicted transposase/invertase (TIGR01784 family)